MAFLVCVTRDGSVQEERESAAINIAARAAFAKQGGARKPPRGRPTIPALPPLRRGREP